MKHCLLILFTLVYGFSKAQDIKRTQNWYFGDSAGLSFGTEPPTVLTNGSLNTIEGCATISDTLGTLLFYTNGVTVWNRNHQVMNNGTGLNGHVSSSQSSLIVPWPNNDSLFYIFTTDAVGQYKGLQFSLVNIKEHGGLGKVITKNTLLHTPVCEKLTATHHKNGNDIWVLVHEFASNNFLVFRLTKNGLNTCPITQSVGSINGISLSDAQGVMKLNSSGALLGNVLFDQSKVEIFSFDNETAKMALAYTIDGFFFPFSLEFSDSLLMYILDRSNNIYQYNLNLTNENNIKQSKTIVGTSDALFSTAIQRSKKEIFISLNDSFFLAKISNPNKIGTQCDFSLHGISLGNSRSYAGLPNFISSYFYEPNLDFTYTTNCSNDSIYFNAEGGVIHSWQIFRNKAIIHSATQATTRFNFSDTGEYGIRLISGLDTVIKRIYIEPKLNLGKDTIVCNQPSFTFFIPANHRCITWQDGKDSARYTITDQGSYYVSAYNIKGCLVTDTIKVSFATLVPPVITKRNDTLFTDSGTYNYKWYYNGDPIPGINRILKVTKNGIYRVEITDSNGCTNTSNNFSVIGLGRHQLKAEDYFSIYPIPASDKLFIGNAQNITIQTITLRDITGKTFTFVPTNELSVKGLSKGIYYIGISDTQNNLYTTKIIIN